MRAPQRQRFDALLDRRLLLLEIVEAHAAVIQFRIERADPGVDRGAPFQKLCLALFERPTLALVLAQQILDALEPLLQSLFGKAGCAFHKVIGQALPAQHIEMGSDGVEAQLQARNQRMEVIEHLSQQSGIGVLRQLEHRLRLQLVEGEVAVLEVSKKTRGRRFGTIARAPQLVANELVVGGRFFPPFLTGGLPRLLKVFPEIRQRNGISRGQGEVTARIDGCRHAFEI